MFITWCIKNWKTLAIGALVVALLSAGYYFRSVKAQRDEARAQAAQLKKDIILEQSRTEQYKSALALKSADLKKYTDTLKSVQTAHDELDSKYAKLWSKYSKNTKDLETATIKRNTEILEGSEPLKALLEKVEVPCYAKSITNDLVVFPSGIPTFANLSSALSPAKRGGLK